MPLPRGQGGGIHLSTIWKVCEMTTISKAIHFNNDKRFALEFAYEAWEQVSHIEVIEGKWFVWVNKPEAVKKVESETKPATETKQVEKKTEAKAKPARDRKAERDRKREKEKAVETKNVEPESVEEDEEDIESESDIVPERDFTEPPTAAPASVNLSKKAHGHVIPPHKPSTQKIRSLAGIGDVLKLKSGNRTH